MSDILLPSQNAPITIPAPLISLETLLYVGLSSEKANELWNHWESWWPTEPYGPRRETDPDDGFGFVVTFQDFIIGWSLTDGFNALGTDDDLKWRQCLEACGINKATQGAIMDPNPRFTHLRRSNSCLYWAKDTITLRYRALKELQNRSSVSQQLSTADTEVRNCDPSTPFTAPNTTILFKPLAPAQITTLLTQNGTLSTSRPS